MPFRVRPMLATLVGEPFNRPNWIYEEKYDGERILAYKDGRGVRLVSRNVKDRTDRFPEIATAVSKLPGKTLVLDGEVVVFDKKGVSHFQSLQEGSGHPVYVVFDCLYSDGKDHRREALSARQDAMRRVLRTGPDLRPARRLDDDAARYRADLQGEIDSASLYRVLARAESDPRTSDVFRKLAAIEDAHAEFWRRNLERIGVAVPSLHPGWRTRILAQLARRFGPAFILPTLNVLEHADSGAYDTQREAVSAGLPAAERSHARALDALAGNSGLAGSSIAQLEGRHRAMGGNALRAAVLGANDGLVSNLSLITGMTGVTGSEHIVLLAGFAGLVAGACSMAMGEWLSVNSARELYANQVAGEAEELKQMPDEEREELVLIYQAKGLSESEARALAARLMANKDTALDTLVREELGLDPQQLGGSPYTAGAWSFCLFAAGAAVPVLPFLLLSGLDAVVASLAASTIALGLVGAGTSLFTGRGALFSAARQIAIGALAALVTYGMGRIAGMALTG